jgi:hypothetical protein
MLKSPLAIARRIRLISGLMIVLAGCSGAQIEVPATLPVPLVDRLPLVIGLHLSDELRSYRHVETLEGGGEWQIALGGAQNTMFENLLTGMFAGVQPVADPQSPQVEVRGVLVPSIEEVQFSTPDQTRSEYFEVWVRYRFELYDHDGSSLGQWPLTAYGKANAQNYGINSREPALQAAALAALRDAMAFFTVQFRSIPAVQTWLDTELRGPST